MCLNITLGRCGPVMVDLTSCDRDLMKPTMPKRFTEGSFTFADP